MKTATWDQISIAATLAAAEALEMTTSALRNFKPRDVLNTLGDPAEQERDHYHTNAYALLAEDLGEDITPPTSPTADQPEGWGETEDEMPNTTFTLTKGFWLRSQIGNTIEGAKVTRDADGLVKVELRGYIKEFLELLRNLAEDDTLGEEIRNEAKALLPSAARMDLGFTDWQRNEALAARPQLLHISYPFWEKGLISGKGEESDVLRHSSSNRDSISFEINGDTTKLRDALEQMAGMPAEHRREEDEEYRQEAAKLLERLDAIEGK